jgi:hypothetical protein
MRAAVLAGGGLGPVVLAAAARRFTDDGGWWMLPVDPPHLEAGDLYDDPDPEELPHPRER